MKYNFSAGPAVLPKSVLSHVQAELMDFGNTGSSVMEISHRSAEFEAVLARAEADFRALLNIPENYAVLMMQGGGTAQFSAIVYNLIKDFDHPVDYIVTGAWSSKAAQEAIRLGVSVNLITLKNNGVLTDPSTWAWSSSPGYVHYCDNETVHGVEMSSHFIDTILAHSPNSTVVCDMSSNILSRPVDVAKYGVIYAGAQKNIGPAGLTFVIVRKDLLSISEARKNLKAPLMMHYKTFADNNSMYNTPPTFAIYVAGLVFAELLREGGLTKTYENSLIKSNLVYSAIKAHELYFCPVLEHQSRMNVPFRILKDGLPNVELETTFLKGAVERGLYELKGHRSVGGIRASLYNALPLQAVQALVDWMHLFASTQSH